jgi:hypothetical protein
MPLHLFFKLKIKMLLPSLAKRVREAHSPLGSSNLHYSLRENNTLSDNTPLSLRIGLASEGIIP